MPEYTICIQTTGYNSEEIAALVAKLKAADLPAPFTVETVPVHDAEGGIMISGPDCYERDVFCEAVTVALA